MVTLPLQIIDLVVDRRALHKEQRSKKADEFRQRAEIITKEVNNIQQRITEIITQYELELERQQNYQDNRQIITFNPIVAIYFPFFVIIILLRIIKTNISNCIFNFFSFLFLYDNI
jgi:hypothetical protein